VIGAKLGEGREAEVYAYADGAVLKLYRPGFPGHRTESLALAHLAGHAVAPQLIDVVHRDGRDGLVLERLAGSDMLTLLERRPARIFALARALAAAHLAIQGVPAPAALPDLREVLATRIESAAMPARLRGFASRLLEGLPAGDRLCHGDLHPGNVLVGTDRARVIDWVNATRGVAAADHARTLLLLRWTRPQPGTPLLARGLVAAGRSMFARAYARAYAKRAPGPPRRVGAWLAVQAAARLSEGVEAETDTLTRLLDRARRGGPDTLRDRGR
jgi:Ser/Thr protein kinase RdoA (MazF antagonist)